MLYIQYMICLLYEVGLQRIWRQSKQINVEQYDTIIIKGWIR